ncbi:MAG: multicopper oxidase domain-containing protein, partial [Arenicellales bacterium]
WTGLFNKGETVRLRLINSSAMTYFDVRVPGAQMTVIQADGNSVEPVKVDELRIAVGETYDVVVGPLTELAYTIFAESLGRTEFGRATLAQKEGLSAEIPALRSPPVLTRSDMGAMAGMSTMANMDSSAQAQGMSNGATMEGMGSKGDPFYSAGSGLMPMAANGGKFLSYQDLRATAPWYEDREATREVEIRLTGNMERYIWSLNGIKFKDAEPIRLTYGERVRFKFVNETMMVHPMHLHGMWSILDTGKGQWDPVKHTINIAPGTTVYTEVEVDAPGEWAFHCHLAYHADAGMFRKVIVEGIPSSAAVEPQQ